MYTTTSEYGLLDGLRDILANLGRLDTTTVSNGRGKSSSEPEWTRGESWEQMQFAGFWVPAVSRLQYNGTKTIVFFEDGSKVVVECSKADTYDRQTALAYAIVKRMYGRVRADGTVDGNGFGGKMKKLVDAGFDQVLEKKNLAAKKAEARARHEAEQKAAAKKAFDRRVRERAEQLKIEETAKKLVETMGLDEKSKSETEKVEPAEQPYVRPDKPFSQFSIEEKRAYWREQNRKRRG